MYIKKEFPKTLNEFIGNKKINIQLKMLIYNFHNNKQDFPNLLFYGNPGLGKTTLTQIIASELKMDLVELNGNQLEPNRLDDIIKKANEETLLFIDEIHSLPVNVQELLFHVVQDRRYLAYNDFLEDYFEIDVPNFPIIGATTIPEKVTKPLRDRFSYVFTMEEYTDKEMFSILLKYMEIYNKNFGLKITKEAADLIVRVTQNVPRILRLFLMKVKDYCVYSENKIVNKRIVKLVKRLSNISEDGLDLYQQKYINYIKESKKPIGLKTISGYLNIPTTLIENVVEPVLLKRGKIIKTPRGRLYNN